MVRFAYWCHEVMFHSIAEWLAEELGVTRWYDLALSDTGRPLEWSMTCDAPQGANWTRDCVASYSYPVQLDITAEETYACFKWAQLMGRLMDAAAGELDAAYQALQRVADSDPLAALDTLDDPEQRAAHGAWGEALARVVQLAEQWSSPDWVDRLPRFPATERQLADQLAPWHLMQPDLFERLARTAEYLRDSLPDLRENSTFPEWWTLWLAWYPARLLEERGGEDPLVQRLLQQFPPAADDREAWEVLARAFGELPLARFAVWCDDLFTSSFARQLGQTLGLGERLDWFRRQPARPAGVDSRVRWFSSLLEASPLPLLLCRDWTYEPSPLPPPTWEEMRAIFDWLTAMRDRVGGAAALLGDVADTWL